MATQKTKMHDFGALGKWSEETLAAQKTTQKTLKL